MEKTRFEYAVYLLNKNIAQLRWHCDESTADLRTTLKNLDSLLRLLTCSSTGTEMASSTGVHVATTSTSPHQASAGRVKLPLAPPVLAGVATQLSRGTPSTTPPSSIGVVFDAVGAHRSSSDSDVSKDLALSDVDTIQPTLEDLSASDSSEESANSTTLGRVTVGGLEEPVIIATPQNTDELERILIAEVGHVASEDELDCADQQRCSTQSKASSLCQSQKKVQESIISSQIQEAVINISSAETMHPVQMDDLRRLHHSRPDDSDNVPKNQDLNAGVVPGRCDVADTSSSSIEVGVAADMFWDTVTSRAQVLSLPTSFKTNRQKPFRQF